MAYINLYYALPTPSTFYWNGGIMEVWICILRCNLDVPGDQTDKSTFLLHVFYE